MSLNFDRNIRIAILDDHPIVLRSFEVVSMQETDMTIVGSFAQSRDLLAFLRENEVDVLILDYILNSDELDGLSLIKQILARHPTVKILMSSSVESLAVIRTAYMIGIKGYIGKREETSTYLAAIRMVASGQRYIPQDIVEGLSQVPTRKKDEAMINGSSNESVNEGDVAELIKLLTPREAEVIRCFLDGMEIIEIAAKLKRSRKTISGHKQTGMRKLGLSSDLELFKYREDLFR
ncbi:two component transcriptional regulator, LuxR family [Candidatus Pantoea symbiotica]|jgi:DNA-binding NarL/FixJ family response regulator|uniref:Two component transcriptional regulator, LuxR family n=1 Tax=Candidatus Pantoea symbiotica TaxID=1884370 RepID=A0A1I3QAX8_9GAMM|nr:MULTISPECIES: response regulator transcription factor [Pantoea]KAJ9433179.1 response regulator transcription factor [Pantoea sp. YR343]SFJ30471.1 two component transcriptional regulator, LuxR family [Pantoea symbiotica]SFU30369.1 two component transcriptional regulator, LuxR family [Pantoea sp. YR525]